MNGPDGAALTLFILAVSPSIKVNTKTDISRFGRGATRLKLQDHATDEIELLSFRID